MTRTYIFVSRHYDATSGITVFTHRLWNYDRWDYVRTVRYGNVTTCRL